VWAASAEALAHDLLEGEAEVFREEGVDARINGRITVAKPEKDGEEDRRDALGTERPHHVHREERHPTNDEPAYDDSYQMKENQSTSNIELYSLIKEPF